MAARLAQRLTRLARAVRHQYNLTKALYAKRAELVAKIPKFWALVLEQAPMDIDEYIQPSDSALLLSALTSLSVSRFEIDADAKKGDPRSVAIRFEFADNDHFEDKVLEKKFWWRYSRDGFASLVSEPVEIKWKKGKDLTDGLLDLVKAAWDEQQAAPKKEVKKGQKAEKVELTAKQKTLKEKIDKTGMGGVSFFAWFGFIGENISAEESVAVLQEDEEERRKRKAGEEAAEKEDEEMDEDESDDEDEDDDDLEIFPTGDAVAMAITDDLWPNALKYFCEFSSGPRNNRQWLTCSSSSARARRS